MVLLLLVIPAAAWTSRTAEVQALGNIATLCKFHEMDKGRKIGSWKDLDDVWGKPLDEVYPLVLPTRRYELFSPPVELPLHEKLSMQIVAMTRKPMWETTRKGNMGRTMALKGPGRYVLYREPDGDYRTRWFDESEVQRLWPRTGRALPVPDDEPERPWVTKARTEILWKRIGLVSLVVLLIGWLAGRVIWRRKQAIA
ncbi:hypothetical protein OKA04_05135 [Luteolibacter flavescens]|uniref:Uncharacterized protein n=1 Tax=Luteolibacter flavescens TaxID=1859460 RepID=A0ABT3FKJ9_9BACT|nr:hypothetical protein [Luteolibacter flavescens]MCW1884103.1 hypothetical protein [Luteolibacter flavescens]